MRAINATIMKKVNRSIVLDWIRREPISRAELAARTELTRASITQIVDLLIQDGLVRETSAVSRGLPGRKQTKLAIVEDALYFCGVCLVARGYSLSLMSLGGDVQWQDGGEVAKRSPQEVLDEIAGKLRALINSNARYRRIHSVSIVATGPLDVKAGRILNPSYLPLWQGLPVAQMLQERLNLPVSLETISNGMAQDELYFGLGCRGVQNFMTVRVTETVGAGLVLNGQVFTGAGGNQPEIGHISINPEGPVCRCGSRGCLERYIAMPYVLENTPYQSWKHVVDVMDEDHEARRIYQQLLERFAFEMRNLVKVYGLERIVLRGDLDYRPERFLHDANRWMERGGVSSGSDILILGDETSVYRIAAMPAFHSLFSWQ